jgi:PAS domain S-box-containing protein
MNNDPQWMVSQQHTMLCNEYFFFKKLIGLLFLFVLTTPFSFALDPHKTISQYTHMNWQTEEGFPQISVQCMTQTQDGYLWIGTQEGIIRFDGVKFTVFDRSNTPGINHNSIRSLLQTMDGSLWLGTEGGLTRMVRGKFTSYTETEGLANNNVADLYEDTQQNLWIATTGGGLCRWKDGSFKTFTVKDGLASNDITSITGKKDGTVFIGTTAGLVKFSHESFTTTTIADGLADNNVRAVYVSPDDVLWVGTAAGLCRLKDGRWKTFTTKDGLANNRVRSIRKDHDGNLWIGTNGGGLSRMWGTQISSYTTYDGLIDGYVSALYEDNEQSFWVGTVGGGLHRFRDGSFTVYGEREGLAQDNTRAIYEARDGSIWIGADIHGFTHFKNGTMKIYKEPSAVANNGARSFCEGPDGSLWIGTYGGGLCRLKDGKITSLTTKDGLPNDIILCLIMSKDSTLWLGTRGGVSRFKNGKFTNFTTIDGLASNVVRQLFQAGDESIWICTNGGLNKFKDGKLTKYTTENGLSYNLVYSIFEDENKALWIGTYGGGLNRLKDGRFTIYTTKQGMYDNSVFQILEDHQKYFWLTCNRGVYRISEKELNEYADGIIQTVHCTVFGTDDGMRSAKCNGTSQPAGIRAHDGRLWIPTMKGVAIIDPANLDRVNHPPPVFIEQVLFDNQLAQGDSLVQIGPGKGELEFHYTALSYAAPKLLSFKYQLVGYDKDWIDAGTRRTAYYTNIPPGNYTFKVIACNNEGVWNLDGASLRVDFHAFFYQTNWFLGLSILMVVLVGLAIYRMRVFTIQRHERELVQLVDDRTKNLQQEISERKLAEEALRDSEEKFRTFAEQSPNMIFINKGGRVVYANAKCEEIMGYSKEEFYAPEFNFLKITAPDFVALVQQKFQYHLHGKDVPPYEYAVLTKHGKRIDVIIASRLIPYENEKAILGIITDITERKQAEESLKQSLSLLQATLESTRDGILVVDGNGKISNYNAQFEEMWNIPEKILAQGNDKQAIDFVLNQLRHPEEFIAKVNYLYSHAEADSFDVLEFKDGKIVERYSHPQRIEGQPVGRVWSFRDVTEQRKLQNQLLQSQKIQSIGTLAGGIAHDFNNILGIILGYSSLLEKRKEDPQKHSESISAINQAVERGAALVQQILTFARKTDVAFEPLSIPDLGRELLSMLKQTFPKTITFTETYATDLPDILADRTQIHQVLLNLCVNARDAMPAGGSIIIEADLRTKDFVRSRFPTADQEFYACIRIIDTGEGMDEITRLRIFDPFFTTKEKGKGTGLGLSVVYGVIQSHHGFVDVESRLGHGTTFTLFLPIPSIVSKEETQILTVLTKPVRGTETILLVEDEYLLLDMLRISLEAEGYTVYRAADGEEAIQMFTLHKKEIDLILSDVGLPKMNGVDEFKKLKEIDPTVKALLASGFFEPESKLELQRAGVMGFIQKPYVPQEILRKVREVLDKNKNESF